MLSTFAKGDVFLSLGENNQVQWRHNDGTLVQTLNTGLSVSAGASGSAFDAAGNLYVTEFNADTVSKFNTSGNLLGTFGSGYNSDDESCLFDAAGNFYVGQADGSRQVLKFNSSGSLLASYSPATEDRGTDWIELAADQKTLFYTSEGHSIKRFDVSANAQLADFVTGLPGEAAYALRILPSGGVLVADSNAVIRLDSSGKVVQTYTPTGGASTLFALNLDPDGTSFWTADLFTGNVYKFDITSGTQLETFSTGALVSGLSVFGEILVSQPPPSNDDLGLLLLDAKGSGSLSVTGNSKVTMTGQGAVVVDSSHTTSAAYLSDQSRVTSTDIDLSGGAQVLNFASFSSKPEHQAPTADPLGLALPEAPTPTFGAVHDSGSSPLTLSPGTYVGGISITGNGAVTLLPGVYYLKGGGFKNSGLGSVTGNGVVLINAPAGPNDTINITRQNNNQAVMSLSAPTSGPFQGIAIFQDPKSSNPISFSGPGAVDLTGVVYAPGAVVNMVGFAIVTINPGAGTATTPPILGALIAKDLKVSGKSDLTINPDAPPGGGGASGGGDDGALGAVGLSVPLAVLPLEGQQAHLSLVPSAGRPTVMPPAVLDQWFSRPVDSTGVPLSGESQLGHSLASRVDSLNGTLVDDTLVSILAPAV